MNPKQSSSSEFLTSFKYGIWVLLIPLWMFGTSERIVSALADGFISPKDFLQISSAAFFLLGWLLLRPTLSDFGADAQR